MRLVELAERTAEHAAGFAEVNVVRAGVEALNAQK